VCANKASKIKAKYTPWGGASTRDAGTTGCPHVKECTFSDVIPKSIRDRRKT
jgi:hypothetical protein